MGGVQVGRRKRVKMACWVDCVQNTHTLDTNNTGVVITWGISARAEISAHTAGVKIICDYMENFSPGWNYCIQRECLKIEKRMNGNYCFSPGWTRLHEKFSAQLGGILACLDRAGNSSRLSGLKLFHVIVINFQQVFDHMGETSARRAETLHVIGPWMQAVSLIFSGNGFCSYASSWNLVTQLGQH